MWGELRHRPVGAVRRRCRAAAQGDSLSLQDRQGPSGKGNGKAAVLAARLLDLWKFIPPATLLILFFASQDAEFSFLKCPALKTKTYSTHVSALSHLLEQKPAFRMETVIFTLLLGFGSFWVVERYNLQDKNYDGGCSGRRWGGHAVPSSGVWGLRAGRGSRAGKQYRNVAGAGNAGIKIWIPGTTLSGSCRHLWINCSSTYTHAYVSTSMPCKMSEDIPGRTDPETACLDNSRVNADAVAWDVCKWLDQGRAHLYKVLCSTLVWCRGYVDKGYAIL